MLLFSGLSKKPNTKVAPPSLVLPPYGRVVDDHVIHLGKDQLLAIIEVEGMPFETASDGVLEAAFESVNVMFASLSKDYGKLLSVWTHLIKRQDKLAERYTFTNPFAQAFADRYYESFASSRYFETRYYVSFLLKIQDLTEGLAKINRIIDFVNQTLGQFGARALGIAEHAPGVYTCEHAEFLARLYNFIDDRIPLHTKPLDEMLDNATLFFSHDALEVHPRPNLDKHFASFYMLRDYPPETWAGMWDFLLDVPCEFVLSQSMTMMTTSSAIKLIDGQINKLLSTGDSAVHQMEEMAAGRGLLAAGQLALGDYQASLMVLGDSPQAAIKNGEVVTNRFSSQGRWVRATVESSIVFSSLFPGSKERPLCTPRSTTNLSCGISFHNRSRGKKTGNPIGDGMAAMPFKTATDNLYYFNCHTSRADITVRGEKLPGHTLILGKTGAGKTTLVSAITAFYQRFEPLFFGIDYNQSMELPVRAMGGKYFSIRDGECTGLQPFQLCAADDKNFVSFLCRLVARCVTDDHHPLSIEDENLIAGAVNGVLLLPREDRRWSALLHHIPPLSPLRPRLLKWCAEVRGGSAGALAWALDAPQNAFDPHRLYRVAFDTTCLLDQKLGRHPATEPILATLLFIKDRMQGKGELMQTVIEEFWVPCMYPLTSELIKGILKAGRLKGEFAMLVSQSPEDALNVPIVAAIIQQTPTKILLANPDASWESYKNMQITEKEFAKVKSFIASQRLALIKQEESSAVVKMDLRSIDGPSFAEFLPILSGSTDAIHRCRQLIEELGTEDPAAWLPILQREIMVQRGGEKTAAEAAGSTRLEETKK